jgi:hypothetical protein
MNKQLEKQLAKTLECCLETKSATQICLIQATHAEDLNITKNCIHSCMEVIEVCDLTIHFITSKSPNIKHCIDLTGQVVLGCIKNCKCLEKSHSYGPIEVNCVKACKKLLTSLVQLKKNI